MYEPARAALAHADNMAAAALLALLAWRLVLAEAIREIHPFDVDSDALSNIELLIPVRVGEPSEYRGGGSASRAHDRGFSRIPADAFTLDDDVSASDETRGRDSYRNRDARPRSLYLDSREGGERSGERSGAGGDAEDALGLWRACLKVAQARVGEARGVLVALCAELLDVAATAERAPRRPAPRACACCRPYAGRRDFIPFGDNPEMVQRYMNVARKKPPPPSWLDA